MKKKKSIFLIDKGGRSYLAGFDRGLNGADLENCNWDLFSSTEALANWDQGKSDGKKEKWRRRFYRVAQFFSFGMIKNKI